MNPLLNVTQVGHTLTGIAIGVLCLPTRASRKQTLLHLAGFGLLANVPDLPFKYWSHDRYDISHSVFVNGLLVFVLGIMAVSWTRLPWTIVAGAAIAWLSHLLLDSFYNHGHGIAIFWPYSQARLNLPIPWFSVVESIPPPVNWTTARIYLVELGCYSLLILGAIVIRRRNR